MQLWHCDGLPSERNLALGSWHSSKEQVGHLLPTHPQQPGEADDLAFADVERDVSGDLPGEALGAEQPLWAGARAGVGVELLEREAEDSLDQLGFVEVGGRLIGDELSIPQDRDARGDREDLIEAVSDE